MNQTWTEFIRSAMRKQEMTQRELAHLLGVSIYQLRHCILDQERVTLDQLEKLVRILHLNLDEFLATSHEDLEVLLEEDVQNYLMTITKRIPKKNRAQFLKALKFLAQCFEAEE